MSALARSSSRDNYFVTGTYNFNNPRQFIQNTNQFTHYPTTSRPALSPIDAPTMPEHKATKPSSEPITISEIPLSLPPRDAPMPAGHQTLLSLIDSQRPRDAKGNPILPRRRKPRADGDDNDEDNSSEPSKEEEGEEEEEEEDLVGPLATSFFWTVPLTFLLIAFEVVVYQQYSQELVYSQILTRCAKAFPSP